MRRDADLADPRVTKTAMMSDVYLPLKPRSESRSSTGYVTS